MNSIAFDLTHHSLNSLVEHVSNEFTERYGSPPTVMVAAPGRVNLIGGHVDYNDGWVLPLALERYVVMASALAIPESSEPSIRLHSLNLDETMAIRLDLPIEPGRKGWGSYLEGVAAGFLDRDVSIPALDVVIGSSVPIGGGLSSSAALEVAMATLMEQVTGRNLEPRDKALLCINAEHRFAGVPCGFMDQISSLFGKANELMLIDCRSLEIDRVPFEADAITVLIANSNIDHELSGSEYPVRRQQCESALRKLTQSSWRDVRLDDVEDAKAILSDVEYRRARHVVTEMGRTLDAANALRNGNWEIIGNLMFASHESLRTDYEVSCPELDTLVDIARSMGANAGVIGSRMTGGGFGGCTVSLVYRNQLTSVVDKMVTRYESATGIKPTCFSSYPARGAHVIFGD